jgi:hypothetical protein
MDVEHDDPGLSEDEALVLELFEGRVIRDAEGRVIERAYLDPGSGRAREAGAAVGRLLRGLGDLGGRGIHPTVFRKLAC